MASLFPQVTGVFQADDAPIGRFWLSSLAVGATTGVIVRLYRALTLSVGPNESLLYVGAAFVVGQLIVLGMATLHLGNFTLRRWVSRAPAFAITEAVTEVVVSLGLLLIGMERVGSARAALPQWPALAINTFVWRLPVVLLYALVLAGIVRFVRRLLIKREHRERTLEAVHQEAQGQE
jgi:hypothetical protein